MQNYREGSHPYTDASRDTARPLEGSGVSLRQLLGVVLAAVLVAIVLSLFSLLAARIDPDGEDCTLTDNAGCIDVGSTGLGGDVDAAGVDLRKGG